MTKIVSVLTAAVVFSAAGLAAANGGGAMKFTIRIENISKPDTFTASNGVKWSLAYSPGTAVVHSAKAPIFSAGKKDRGMGLEAQAEDGDPTRLAKYLQGAKGVKSVAVFRTPAGSDSPGPITPGAAYEVTLFAVPGDRLSLTLMMGQSNDWFYAPKEAGIELFKNGHAMSGDITSQMLLWNAGTEVDQEPGIGPDQGPRQMGPNTGKNENGLVRQVNDGKSYTDAPSVMRVTIKPAL